MTTTKQNINPGKKFWPFNDYFYEYELKINQEEQQQIYQFLKLSPRTFDKDQITTYQTVNNILNLPLLNNLKKQILDILNSQELEILTSWGQLYDEKDKHKNHNHLGSAISGVIYVYGEGKGTKFFHPLNTILEFCSPDYNYIYQPDFKIGKMILFPGYITHGVETDPSNKNRCIISFNARKILYV